MSGVLWFRSLTLSGWDKSSRREVKKSTQLGQGKHTACVPEYVITNSQTAGPLSGIQSSGRPSIKAIRVSPIAYLLREFIDRHVGIARLPRNGQIPAATSVTCRTNDYTQLTEGGLDSDNGAPWQAGKFGMRQIMTQRHRSATVQ